MSSGLIHICMINTGSGAAECTRVICVVADRFAKISASAFGVSKPCPMPTGRPADEPLSRRGLQKGQDSAKKSGRFPRRHAGPWCWFWRPFSAAGAFIVVADGAALWAREAMSVWGFEVAKTPRSTFSCTGGCPQNFAEVWSPLRDSGSCAGRPETGAEKTCVSQGIRCVFCGAFFAGAHMREGVEDCNDTNPAHRGAQKPSLLWGFGSCHINCDTGLKKPGLLQIPIENRVEKILIEFSLRAESGVLGFSNR